MTKKEYAEYFSDLYEELDKIEHSLMIRSPFKKDYSRNVKAIKTIVYMLADDLDQDCKGIKNIQVLATKEGLNNTDWTKEKK